MSDWTQFWELQMAYFFPSEKEKFTQKYYFEITIWGFERLFIF